MDNFPIVFLTVQYEFDLRFKTKFSSAQYDRQSLLFFTEKRRENLIFYNCAANFDILYLLVFTYDGKPFEVFVEMKKKAGMKYITWLSMAL